MPISNGFKYPPKPDLPTLDAITERLISSRLPFTQLRRIRYERHGIVGQVVNMPVDVNTIVTFLPRNVNDDVSSMLTLIHKSTYLSGVVKRVVEQWLNFVINRPLYTMYNIVID